MKAWQVVRKGPPSKALELRDVPIPEPRTGQLRVRVATTVCNLNEVDGCYGRYRTVDPPLPYTLGMEAVGVVDAVGEGAEIWLGQRVMMTGAGATGAHAEYVVGDQAMAFECPDRFDDHSAAAFYFPFHVAYVSLVERGGLKAGETVLVHGGAGGVGSAAVQLAKALGARVIATAGSPCKSSSSVGRSGPTYRDQLFATGDWADEPSLRRRRTEASMSPAIWSEARSRTQTMRVMAYGGTPHADRLFRRHRSRGRGRPTALDSIIFGNISVAGRSARLRRPECLRPRGDPPRTHASGEKQIHAHLLAAAWRGARFGLVVHDVTPYTELPAGAGAHGAARDDGAIRDPSGPLSLTERRSAGRFGCDASAERCSDYAGSSSP